MAHQQRTTICRQGWYYLLLLAVILLGALLWEQNLLLTMAVMLVGPALLNWRLVAKSLRGLDVRREAPRHVRAGEPLVVQVDVSNGRKRMGSWAVVVEDPVCPDDGLGRSRSIRPNLLFSYVAAGSSQRRAYRGRLTQRGRYRLGPLKVSTRFPFGLFRRTLTFDRSDALTVVPRLGRLMPKWNARHHETAQGTQRRLRRPGRAAGEFYGVREWQTGDSRRWIHWRSSARHGSLVVRQFEQSWNHDVAVLVDLWQPAEPTPEHLDNVELAVSFAATVVADVCRRGGCNLLLGITGPEPEWVGGPTSTPLLEQSMERLAVAAASCQDHLPRLLELALGQIQPGTEVVLVSPRNVPLNDTERFAALRGEPAGRTVLERLRLVNTASNALADYFQPE